jgi:hypothetical protein
MVVDKWCCKDHQLQDSLSCLFTIGERIAIARMFSQLLLGSEEQLSHHCSHCSDGRDADLDMQKPSRMKSSRATNNNLIRCALSRIGCVDRRNVLEICVRFM